MACNGTCSFQPDGGWQLRLDRLSVDRLRMDRQFMQALPPQLKKGLGELNATGPMSLQGSIVLARGANPAEPMTSQWNLNVGLNQVGVDCGVRLENIYGNVGLAGWSDGTRFQMRGELALDSLTCRDHQFTQVLGPFWIDDQEAMFGSWVARRDNQTLAAGPAAGRLAARDGQDLRRHRLRRRLDVARVRSRATAFGQTSSTPTWPPAPASWPATTAICADGFTATWNCTASATTAPPWAAAAACTSTTPTSTSCR